MTVRLSVSLSDDTHAMLVRLAEASEVSAASVVRMILADVLPKMSSVLDVLGKIDPADAPRHVAELDAWAAQMRRLMHDAPDALGAFRNVLDDPDDDPVTEREIASDRWNEADG